MTPVLEHADPDTGVRLWQLCHDPLFTNHLYTDNPSFSADSQRFIFMAGRGFYEDCQVWLYDIPSGAIRLVSPLRGIRGAVIQGHQCWARSDGTLLATIISFVHGRWQGSIWAARPGDQQARCVSDAFDFRHPSATLDGKTIACDEWDEKDIYLVDTASGRHERLCHTGAVDWDKLHNAPAHSLPHGHPHPTISPDGRVVLFNSNRTGTAHAWVAFVREGQRP